MSNNFPSHIAIIMDGNGRWAGNLGRRRIYGHFIGSKVADEVVKKCSSLEVKYLTLYTFSTENWKRPKSEIRFLISLLNKQLINKKKQFHKYDIKFNVIGDISSLPDKTQNIINDIMFETKHHSNFVLTLALNYGSRKEIVETSKKLYKLIKDGKINISDIDENMFSRFLYTEGVPDVDLMIRTGKEKRISNFLLWQSSYAEFVFFDKYWPDFTVNDLEMAIEEFKTRKRKFGGL